MKKAAKLSGYNNYEDIKIKGHWDDRADKIV